MSERTASSSELRDIYSRRFEGQAAYRNAVWGLLTRDFFSRWTEGADVVLDLGCGYGEFINHSGAKTRMAIDLNPESRDRLVRGVLFFQQDGAAQWPLPNDSVDVVFSSNFLEHLPSKTAMQTTLQQVSRCLRPGGRVVLLGPNIKYCHGAYWDFFDHHLPLTELSVAEALASSGLCVDYLVDRFLPYSMSQGFRPPLWTLHVYLHCRWLWRFFGKQFLIVATKQRTCTATSERP